MAQIRGVEIGKVLRTPADVIEHCYPEMHKRNQQTAAVAAPPVAPVAEPPSAPVRAPKSKSKKVKANDALERNTVADPVAKDAEPDPFKDI